MARTTALMELPPADRRRSLYARNGEGREVSSNDDASMEQTLKNMRITPVPNIRRGKVLELRRQLAEGTYEVANRLDKAIDRMLESLTT